MSQAHLLIKCRDRLLVEKIGNRLDFINVPPYSKQVESFTNVSVFITLLLNSLLDENFNSKEYLNFFEWENKFEIFIPEYLYELEPSTYIYDLDLLLKDNPDLSRDILSVLTELPPNLEFRSIRSLYHLSVTRKKQQVPEEYVPEEIPYNYHFSKLDEYLSLKLDDSIRYIYQKRTDKDVLLLYSGGKDSTLSAIRLHNAGYNVHFIHFNNGHMKDQDKPYLTYRKTFSPEDGYYFSYLHKSVNMEYLFNSYFSKYSKKDDDSIITSELRCLSCRMAMYTEAIRIARQKGFHYIAEGARISQKFMLEQKPILNRLQTITNSYGIELIFPVLDLQDDQEEINEIIANGYSSKTWESKCLVGRPTRDKTAEEEETIIEYYEKKLKPKMLNLINNQK